MSKTKTIRATLGCSECHWNSVRGNCIKFGFSSRDINEGKWVNTVDHGSFRLRDVKSCVVKVTHEEHAASERKKMAIEKARKETLARMPNKGMIG